MSPKRGGATRKPRRPSRIHQPRQLFTRTMTQTEQRYRRDISIVSRQIAGETILVPIRQQAAEVNSIYMLNETAASAWALIDGQRTLSEVRDAIVVEYEVSEEEAERDLAELVAQLEAIGAVARG
jgi:hypothetical protein